MARPAKSVNVKTGAISGEEESLRRGIEEKLRGASVQPSPPAYLSDDQKAVFAYIVDVYVLESTAIAISRIRQINAMVNDDAGLLLDGALQSTRAKYQSDMWRGANELCLSPQARAKIGSLAAQAVKQKEDPLLKALMSYD